MADAPFFLCEIWQAAERFLSGFDGFTYNGARPGRLLSTSLMHALVETPHPYPRERVFLDSFLGRLYLQVRARKQLRRLDGWGKRGMILKWSASYDHLLDAFLPLLKEPYGYIAHHEYPGTEIVHLRKLVPGTWRRGVDRPIADLYRKAWRANEDLQASLPADPSWFQSAIHVALDTLDSARVFWEKTGAPGGLVNSHLALQDMALASEGRRLGRRVICLQHGYFYDVVLWEREFCDLYFVWDDWTRRIITERSGGLQRSVVVGHSGIAKLMEAHRPRKREGPPRVLLLTSAEPDTVFQVYIPYFRALSAEGVPWKLLWKPHQRTAAQREPFGPACEKLVGGSTYEAMADADLVLSPISSTLAEARLMGLRAACLAHPRETWIRRWCENNQVPLLLPTDDVVGALARALEAPVPPAIPMRWGPDSPARMAAMADAALRGEPVPEL